MFSRANIVIGLGAHIARLISMRRKVCLSTIFLLIHLIWLHQNYKSKEKKLIQLYLIHFTSITILFVFIVYYIRLYFVSKFTVKILPPETVSVTLMYFLYFYFEPCSIVKKLTVKSIFTLTIFYIIYLYSLQLISRIWLQLQFFLQMPYFGHQVTIWVWNPSANSCKQVVVAARIQKKPNCTAIKHLSTWALK